MHVAGDILHNVTSLRDFEPGKVILHPRAATNITSLCDSQFVLKLLRSSLFLEKRSRIRRGSGGASWELANIQAAPPGPYAQHDCLSRNR